MNNKPLIEVDQAVFEKQKYLAELEEDWRDLLEDLGETLDRKPDLQSLLFLIGVQEFGDVRKFSKEQKQDLMHVGVCHLLTPLGYFEFTHKDMDGWPHYKAIKPMPELVDNLASQEVLLKEQILEYFD
ncbi:MAG: hypothetical protein ACPGXL_08870 [Chitinophagales bacterium]